MSDRPSITGSNCIHCGSARLPWIVCDDCGKSQGEAFAAEIASLRSRLERAEAGFAHIIRAGSKGFSSMELVRIAEEYERELENGGGDE